MSESLRPLVAAVAAEADKTRVEASAASVLDVIRTRAAAGSMPGERQDPWSVALVVEGGAMRGVISAAMTAGLEQLGLLNTFDHVFGSSVGSINGGAFIAGRAALCTASYYNEMTTPEFFDLKRLLRGRPALSLKFVLDVSAETTRPIPWENVVSSPIRLHPIATSLATLSWADLGKDGFTDKADLKEALRASSQYPVLAGPPVVFHEGEYLDASLSLSIPARAAVQAGCTHLLVLRTRPADAVRSTKSFLDRRVLAPKLAKVNPGLVPIHLARDTAYAEELSELRQLVDDGVAYSIAPDPSVPMSAFERSRERTLEAAREGIRSVYRVFEGRQPLVSEVLRAY